MGDGTTVNKTIPTKISITGATIITAAAGGNYSVVVSSVGTMYTFGGNSFGQLGDGTTAPYITTPTLVEITNETIIGVSAGSYHCMAIGSTGNLYTWGNNEFGQIGNGLLTDINTPTLISISGETMASIEAGYSHSMAVTASGKLYVWGNNLYKQLGIAGSNVITPTRVIIPNETIITVSGGTYHSMAVTESGKLYCWGYNVNSQLGDGTIVTRTTPTRIAISDEIVESIVAGHSHSIAISTDGKIFTWGSNGYGQLGDGRIFNSALPRDMKRPKKFSFNIPLEDTINYSLTASHIVNTYKYIYRINYDTSKYAVDDLCTATSAQELGVGYIAGTNVVILDHDTTAGLITMTFNDSSNSFTGILDNISFRKISEGEGKINVVSYCAQ